MKYILCVSPLENSELINVSMSNICELNIHLCTGLSIILCVCVPYDMYICVYYILRTRVEQGIDILCVACEGERKIRDSKVFVSGKSICTNRESNPGQMLGRHLCYHYTIGASLLQHHLLAINNLYICTRTNNNTTKNTSSVNIQHTHQLPIQMIFHHILTYKIN